MTDVVKIAKECRATLAAEIDRLDEFLRMAEKLKKYNRLESSKASGEEPEKDTDLGAPATAHPYFVSAGANGTEAKASRSPT